MLLDQADWRWGRSSGPGGGFAAWAMSQATPFLMRKAAGRVLVWVWKADPELLVVMAQVQEATPQLRAARAGMPMEYDDTETFRGTYLGVGEKLAIPLPADQRTPPFATYTWDTGSHFVNVTAVCSDRERFGTVIGRSTNSRGACGSRTMSGVARRRTSCASSRRTAPRHTCRDVRPCLRCIDGSYREAIASHRRGIGTSQYSNAVGRTA